MSYEAFHSLVHHGYRATPWGWVVIVIFRRPYHQADNTSACGHITLVTVALSSPASIIIGLLNAIYHCRSSVYYNRAQTWGEGQRSLLAAKWQLIGQL